MKLYNLKKKRFLSGRARRYLQRHPQLIKVYNNIGWLFFEKAVRITTGLFVGILMARYLGPQKFGIYNYALSFVALFAAISTLGLNGIVVRDLIKDRYSATTILGTAFMLQLVGGLAAFVIVVGAISCVRPGDDIIKPLVIIVGFGLVFSFREVTKYWFESQLTSKYAIRAEVGVFLFISMVKIGMILIHAPLVAFIWIVLLEIILATIALFYAFLNLDDAPRSFAIQAQRARSMLKDSAPLILSGISISLAMRVDQIMLGEMGAISDVGLYAVGVKLAESLVLIGTIVATSMFPRFVELKGNDFNREFIAIVRYVFYAMFLASIIISVSSSTIVNILFGATYAGSSSVLSILIFSIPFTFVNVMSTQYLLKHRYHSAILLRQVGALALNVFLNFILIRSFGILGAAIATVVTDIALVFIFDIGRKKFRHLFQLKICALMFFSRKRLNT